MKKLDHTCRYVLLGAVPASAFERGYPRTAPGGISPNYYLKVDLGGTNGSTYLYAYIPSRVRDQKRHLTKDKPYAFVVSSGGLVWIGDDTCEVSGVILETHLPWDKHSLYIDIPVDLSSCTDEAVAEGGWTYISV
jgi:hypothetical protein